MKSKYIEKCFVQYSTESFAIGLDGGRHKVGVGGIQMLTDRLYSHTDLRSESNLGLA